MESKKYMGPDVHQELMTATPFVSVIVPCRNEASFIDRCVASILASDYSGRLEIVIAEGMSTDGTRERLNRMAAKEPRIRVIDNPEGRTPVALNRAIAASHGDVVLRFDGHATMPPDYMRRCVGLLLSSGADNAGGLQRVKPQSNGLFAAPIAAALGCRFGVGDATYRFTSRAPGPRPADTVFGGCWKRELFARIGGFNERLMRSQDMEFNMRIRRAGGSIMFDPGIACDYYSRATFASFSQHNFRNGVWAVMPFAFSDGIPVRPRHLIPLLFVVALAVSLALPFPWMPAIAAPYAVANLAASIHQAVIVRKPSYLLLMPIVFAGLHIAYGLGSVWGCFKCLWKLSKPEPPHHASRTQT